MSKGDWYKILREINGLRGDDLKIAVLQKSTIEDENERVQKYDLDYDDPTVRVATVHARQDIILLVGQTGVIIKQLKAIRRVALFIFFVLLIILFKLLLMRN